ncbi:ABC-type Fe3+ transport system, substrate-binding protein [Lachnospiraceae bacterium XPB1003]|nr:ABC-type Fe3+ transport system, substrate-binding protein [Lachnospiraceae bacterium XPB1003]
MDCGLSESLHFTVENKNARLLGRVPCVVQLPFQDYLDKELGDRKLYNIALAEFGQNWLTDLLKENDPDVIIGVGIEGMVNNKALQDKGYTSVNGSMLQNKDFSDIKDPRGDFDIYSCIPLVMVVDKSQAAGRSIPKKFTDVLSEEYKESIVYPDDGHMLDGIMLTYIHKAAGDEGLRAFKQNCFAGAHPSQMIKPGGLAKKPFIMLMPWVFAKLKAAQPNMELIWPEDGAPILPIIVTSKDNEKAKAITEVLFGKEAGDIFIKNGFFPSAVTDTDNKLPGKLQFVGWDYIYSDELPDIIAHCKSMIEG